MPFTWTCPFCGQPTTINEDDISIVAAVFSVRSKENKARGIHATAIRCPNPDCHDFSLDVRLVEPIFVTNHGWSYDNEKQKWPLLPRSRAKSFPDYIPQGIRQDYEEACLIRRDSPKAAAALARRCLQGMIRDFWKVTKDRLVQEIEGIKDKVDPMTWSAIDAVRSVGNIGAHMEKDVNQIIDVDPGEADQLIELVETLLQEWYVVRHERDKRMKAVVEMAGRKAAQKRGPPPSGPTT